MSTPDYNEALVTANGEFFLAIDWVLLRQQKQTLLRVLDRYEGEERADLDGILHLLDSLQDHAVDIVGIAEEVVFVHAED